MLSTMKIGTKVFVGFLIALGISLFVGVMGYWGITTIEDDIDEIGVVRLQSVNNLQSIAREAQYMRGNLRTLTISGLPPEIRSRTYDYITASRQRYEEAWAIYEPLPQSAEEAEVWNRFVPAWNAWRTENNRFLELSRRLDEFGVANPNEFKAFIEQFTKDHYMLVQRTLHQLHMGEEHRGGADHSACNFGRWASSFQTTNSELRNLISAIAEPHRRFHEAIGSIQRHVEARNQNAAQEVYQRDLNPALRDVFRLFEGMGTLADQAVQIENEMEQQDFEKVTPAQQEAVQLLSRLVEINTQLADEAVVHAHEQAAMIITITVISIIIGAAIMVLLGVFLARSIGSTINTLNNESARLTEAAVEGRLDTRGDVDCVPPEFQPIITGVNETLDAVIGPLNVSAEYIDRISKGDIPAKITDTYKGDFNEIKNNLNTCIDAVDTLVSDAKMLAQAAVDGKLDTRADASKHQGEFRAIVTGVNDTLDAVIGPLNVSAEYIDRISKGDIPAKITDTYKGDFNEIKNNLNQLIEAENMVVDAAKKLSVGNTNVKLIPRSPGDDMIISLIAVVDNNQHDAEAVQKVAAGNLDFSIKVMSEHDIMAQSIVDLQKNVGALVSDAKMLAQAAVDGKLDTRADASKHQGEFRAIVTGVNDTLDAVLDPIKEAANVLDHLSNYDLRSRVKGDYKGDHAKIKTSLNATATALHDAMCQVAEAVEQISSASEQIASTSQQIADGSSQQASALEQTASSLEEMSSMTAQSADNSTQARLLTDQSASAADKGTASMAQMMQSMSSIRQSSEGTAAIIKDINDIAFQTNLLALNAAVEAARAGDAGRGFAVVAEEVRNLAQRAKEAAKKTEDLIQESVHLSEAGEGISREVNGNLSEILSSVSKVANIVNEVAVASQEQARGIKEVNKAVTSVDQVVQQAAANSEEAASASEELAAQAQELSSMVGRFTLARTSMERNRSAVRRPVKAAESVVAKPAAAKPRKANGTNGTATPVHPDSIIPMGDDTDFATF